MTQPIDFQFETPEDNLGYLLWQTTMQWQRQMNRALDSVGLTHTQFVILIALAWLSRDDEQVTQKAIAEHSNTDRMMVSKILRHLQKNGLIERQEHATDTRAKCVFLTDKGAETLQRAITIKNTANDQFFSQLSEQKALTKALRELIA